MKVLWLGLGVCALGLSFAAGRLSAPSAVQTLSSDVRAALVQAQGQPAQDDPREVFPLVPGPGDEPGPGQGQQPGPQQPGNPPGQGEGECTVLMFKDGRMYRMQPGPGQQPGQSPGQQPGPGERGDGQPGGDNELFPIQPFDAPSLPLPGLPPTTAPEMRV